MRTHPSKLYSVILCLAVALQVQAQTPPAAPPQPGTDRLSIDRIFKNPEFRATLAPATQWTKDGLSYIGTRSDGKGGTEIIKVDVASGNATVLAEASVLVDEQKRPFEIEDIILSGDESRALLYHNSERVWRRNTKGYYHLIDFASKRVVAIPLKKPGPQMFAKLSPDGKQIAFVRDKNIDIVDASTMQERALTTDGARDLINGTSDWAYEEEFDLRDGFRWSPDGNRIAYWHFNQGAIPLFPITDEMGWYPRIDMFRYPKAGYQNSVVQLGVVDVGSAKTTWIDTGLDSGQYLPRMDWVDANTIGFQRLPRTQKSVEYVLADLKLGRTHTIVSESDSAYVDVQEPVWINEGREFLWLSDRSGWRQVYLYDRTGAMLRQLTNDGSDVLSISGVDQKNGDIYVQVAAPNATQRQIYRYAMNGKTGGQITEGAGVHAFEVSPTGRYAVDTHSSLNDPPTVTIDELPSMKAVRVLIDNAALRDKVAALKLRPAQLIQIPAADGLTALDAYRIVPPDFDSTKRYPVLMYVYGGPAIPSVLDQWGNARYMWHQMLAQEGYIVVCVDNRGAAWRGREFRKMTQLKLGLIESDDQIAAAKWIGAQSWGDPKRIGIWGWSYGGYMTLMSTTRGGNVFKMGISVAPVTDWKLYDTIYTERFMWTPQDNKERYEKSSPQTYVDSLTARLLLVHGTGDDNVHPQNTMQFVQKLEMARKSFYLMLYPNKTHSISGPGATIHLYDTFTRFIRENL